MHDWQIDSFHWVFARCSVSSRLSILINRKQHIPASIDNKSQTSKRTNAGIIAIDQALIAHQIIIKLTRGDLFIHFLSTHRWVAADNYPPIRLAAIVETSEYTLDIAIKVVANGNCRRVVRVLHRAELIKLFLRRANASKCVGSMCVALLRLWQSVDSRMLRLWPIGGKMPISIKSIHDHSRIATMMASAIWMESHHDSITSKIWA